MYELLFRVRCLNFVCAILSSHRFRIDINHAPKIVTLFMGEDMPHIESSYMAQPINMLLIKIDKLRNLLDKIN